jgi:hypothetical protein
MIDRPKFEDWQGLRNEIISLTSWNNRELGWDACLSACETIISGLEAELEAARKVNQAILAVKSADERAAVVGLEKQLAEKDAEIAGAFLEQRVAEARTSVKAIFDMAYSVISNHCQHEGEPEPNEPYCNECADLASEIANRYEEANRAKAEGARKGEIK